MFEETACKECLSYVLSFTPSENFSDIYLGLGRPPMQLGARCCAEATLDLGLLRGVLASPWPRLIGAPGAA